MSLVPKKDIKTKTKTLIIYLRRFLAFR